MGGVVRLSLRYRAAMLFTAVTGKRRRFSAFTWRECELELTGDALTQELLALLQTSMAGPMAPIMRANKVRGSEANIAKIY